MSSCDEITDLNWFITYSSWNWKLEKIQNYQSMTEATHTTTQKTNEMEKKIARGGGVNGNGG